MRTRLLVVMLFVALRLSAAAATQFETFPERTQSISPDHRYMITSEDAQRVPSEITGTIHTLYLTEISSGKKRKLYDYVRRVSVAWADSNRIILTDYLAKKTSRVLVFTLADQQPAVVIDAQLLARILPWSQSQHLIHNDHVYVEVLRLENRILALHAWGYGTFDPQGFALDCRYRWDEGSAICEPPQEREQALRPQR